MSVEWHIVATTFFDIRVVYYIRVQTSRIADRRQLSHALALAAYTNLAIAAGMSIRLWQLVPVVVQPDRNINAVLTPKPGYRVCIQILNHEYAVYYKHTDRRTDGHADCNTSLPYREWPGGVVAGRWTCAIM